MPVDGPGELSVRTAAKGGGVAQKVREIRGTAVGKARLVIFVHGYANSHQKASKSYKHMHDRLLNWHVPSLRLNDCWWFFWPGDLSIPIINKASYAWQINHAEESADRLAAYLHHLTDLAHRPVQVVFVAHSLGNRVVLETIKRVEAEARPLSRRPIIESIVLMAAAIPDGYCEPRAPLAKMGRRLEINLYSKVDSVLKVPFRLGETLAREGFFPQAVGYSGKPTARWSSNLVTIYKHGEYWDGRFSSQQVSRVFGAAPPRVPRANPLVEHGAASPRAIPIRRIDAFTRNGTGNVLGKYPL
jgi:esterase/lipase superfamily enzyme